jgi:hypothetical protein
MIGKIDTSHWQNSLSSRFDDLPHLLLGRIVKEVVKNSVAVFGVVKSDSI